MNDYFHDKPDIVLCHFPTLTIETSYLLRMSEHNRLFADEVCYFLTNSVINPDVYFDYLDELRSFFVEFNWTGGYDMGIDIHALERDADNLLYEVMTAYDKIKSRFPDKLLHSVDLIFPPTIVFIFTRCE